MRIRQLIGWGLMGTLFLLGGCRKYPEQQSIQNASYIRVFNDLNTTVDFLNNAQAPPFLTFIMDPHLDASGAPDTGQAFGDFLGTRQRFSLSYPINEGNSLTNTTTTLIGSVGSGNVIVDQAINYEYPGNAHVLAAPAINGFDLSSWAQVPSGKHRFVFVLRPQTDTPFTRLGAAIRKDILIDTTVDLEPGEVYTLEALSLNLDQNQYGMYVRKEQFIHQSFQANQIYVGFVNLSGVPPLSSQYGYFPDFSDSTVIYYTYYVFNDQLQTFYPITGYNNNYYTTLNQRMSTQISYLGLPMLPQSAFFFQDSLRKYATALNSDITFSRPGTFPFVQFALWAQDSVSYQLAGGRAAYDLNCSADPTTFNDYAPGAGVTLNYEPNLNLITNVGGVYNVYPTLNIMEMVYDRVYMMQIQNGFNQVPNQ